jgi:hypothetical protein
LGLEPFYGSASRERFYAKYYPLAAGLTNIDLRRHWMPTATDTLPDYWRAVSTSAAVPMVFSLTTTGPNLNIAASFSTHVYSHEQARRALACFSGLLREF